MDPSDCDFYQVSLKLILKNAKGEILFIKAQNKDTYAGFYDLPVGRTLPLFGKRAFGKLECKI